MPRKQGRGYRAAGRMLVTAAGAAALLLSVAAANAPRGEGRAARTGAAAAARITAAPTVGSGDSPAGFWYGTDSWPMSVGGTGPYREPVIGGAYGGYIGMAGNWARWLTGGDKVAWSKTNSHQANVNHNRYHLGIGTGVYWFMGGPGVDPHYNGTAAEARAWGQRQAAKTLSAISHAYVTYPVVFADVELPATPPASPPPPTTDGTPSTPLPAAAASAATTSRPASTAPN
jgi:hypothetical protein